PIFLSTAISINALFTLSLHDALPICRIEAILDGGETTVGIESTVLDLSVDRPRILRPGAVSAAEIEEVIGPVERLAGGAEEALRSEEHTSELQSRENLVCRLLPVKKK